MSVVAHQEFITKLAASFPPCFTEDCCEPHRPLKTGIRADIVALGVLTEREAKAALRLYASRTMYQRAIAAGGVRIDLNGNAAGEVTAEEVETAKRLIMRIKERRAMKAKNAAATKFARRAANGTPATPAPTPAAPKRLGLSELRAAALARRAQAQTQA